MKHYLSLMLCLALFAGANAQTGHSGKATPPEAVVMAFEKEFVGSKHAKWAKEEANFEVNFSRNGKDGSALYDTGGKLLETEWDIPIAELPKSVAEYLSLNYKGVKVSEASKIIKADGTIQYEAEVKGKDLMFDADGKFINKKND